MIHRVIILAAFGMLATSTLTKAQQSPLTVSEISPGLFVHTGVMELISSGTRICREHWPRADISTAMHFAGR